MINVHYTYRYIQTFTKKYEFQRNNQKIQENNNFRIGFNCPAAKYRQFNLARTYLNSLSSPLSPHSFASLLRRKSRIQRTVLYILLSRFFPAHVQYIHERERDIHANSSVWHVFTLMRERELADAQLFRIRRLTNDLNLHPARARRKEEKKKKYGE